MQAVYLVVGTVAPAMWLEEAGAEALPWPDTVYLAVHLCAAALAWVCLAMVRRGHLMPSARLFLAGLLLLILVLHAAVGLQGQGVTRVVQAFPLALAGMLFGRKALWQCWLFLLLCLCVGAAHDLHVAGYQEGAIRSMAEAVAALATVFLLMAILIDAAAMALLSGLTDVRARSRELDAIKHHLEEEMKQRECAIEQMIHGQKVGAVGQLAGGVAHDFNNILGVILGYTQWSQRHVQQVDMREALHGIEGAARRGTAVTRKLLSLTRHDACHTEVFDAGEALRSLDDMLRQLLGPEIRVSMMLSDAALPIRFDRGQFELVVLNIAANARDAMAGGGRLDVKVATALTPGVGAGAGPATSVAITLRDNGVGMSKSLQQRIFEPFFTTKEAGQGSGLGLPVVRRMMRASGAEVFVQSKAGQGSCFTLHFPLAQPGADGSAVAPSARRVLLADDNDERRGILVRALEEGGYRVAGARGGQEAEHLLLRGEVPDLLIAEHHMPNMSGLMLIQCLRHRHPDVPAILMSDQGDEDGALASRLPPDVERLPKPFSPDLLLQYVYMMTSWPEERSMGDGV